MGVIVQFDWLPPGGCVRVSRKGTPRVVWERQRKEGQEGYDCIPFLGVSRSLGDFWSFNPRTKQFIVSPKPDVYVHPLNPKNQKFVVIASDGLWNVMSPDEVVGFIWDYEHEEGREHRDVVNAVINKALDRWAGKHCTADNIAVLIAFLSDASVVSSCCVQSASVPREHCDNIAQTTSMSEARTEDVAVSDGYPLTKSLERQYLSPHIQPNDMSLSLEVENLTGLSGIVSNDFHTFPPLSENSSSLLHSIGKHINADNVTESVPLLKRSKLNQSPDDPLNCVDKVDSHCESTEQSVKQLYEASVDDDSGVQSDGASPEPFYF